MRNLIIALFTIAGLAGLGCRKTAGDLSHYQPIPDTKEDTLRMICLLPDSTYPYGPNTGYVLYLNDSLYSYTGRGMYTNNTVLGLPPAIPISGNGGTYDLKIARYKNTDTLPLKTPPSSHLLCETQVSVPAHSGFGNLFVYDSAGAPTIRYIPVSTADPGAPAPHTFKLRVVNFDYQLGTSYQAITPNSGGTTYPVQLLFQDSAPVPSQENIPFATASQYVQFDYGTYQFLLRNTVTDTLINNSGQMNDITGTFNLSPQLVGYYANNSYSSYNWLFPNFSTDYVGGPNISTLHAGNIGSYQFAAGGCYSIYVIGNMYTIQLDRQYGVGTLDNYGKLQLVNVAQGTDDLSINISSGGGQNEVQSLAFGSYTEPMIVPAGNVTLTFSSGGQTVYTYSASVPRLANYTFYYGTDLKQVPYVFPESNVITPTDWIINGTNTGPPYVNELVKVSTLNLSPDAGNLYFTSFDPTMGGVESGGGASNAGFAFKGSGGEFNYDGIDPPTQFNCRLASTRTDSLANAIAASLPTPFPIAPAPGTYTLVAAGLLDGSDHASQMKLILVKKTNYVPKAQ
ncbi:MAG TPA: hypothetical protein VGS79_25060 [Puia sp.]|nr:hypothetical protein [Puia sp.]